MSARHQMAGLIMTGQRFATLSNLDMQQCPKMFCNFVQKVLAKNILDRYNNPNTAFAKSFNKRKASTDHWMTLSVGSSAYHISLLQLRKDKNIAVEWNITDDKELYKVLYSHKEEIEANMGMALDWRELPEKKASRILITHPAEFDNKDKWPEQFDWAMDVAMKMKKAFKKYL